MLQCFLVVEEFRYEMYMELTGLFDITFCDTLLINVKPTDTVILVFTGSNMSNNDILFFHDLTTCRKYP